VLKAKQGEQGAESWAREFTAAHPAAHIHVIDQPLDTIGVTSLIAACDCFVSLHRSEGFGRGLGEAMALGRLALGTNWSGNTDFLNASNGLPVNFALKKLAKDEYPHWQGQHWAEPDLDHAEALISHALQNPTQSRQLAHAAQSAIRQTHGNRAIALNILARLRHLVTK
jgi:hypothetical protein